MTRRLRQFALFWYDFVIGDDWRAAVGVVLALGITKLVAAPSFTAWWIVPVAVGLGLPLSFWHFRRAQRKRQLGGSSTSARPSGSSSNTR